MENTIVVKLGGVASDNLTEDFFQQIIQWQAANKKLYLFMAAGIILQK